MVTIRLFALLLANRADINARNKHGETALHCAAENNHIETVELLLANVQT